MSRADWYPDPADPNQMRWWDGQAWTNRVADMSVKTYAASDYRSRGQIREHDYFLETRKSQVSEALNQASVRPPQSQEREAAESLISEEEERNSWLGRKSNDLKLWFQSELNIPNKKKALLALLLVGAFVISSSIFYVANQIDNNWGRPTQSELVDIKAGMMTAPNVIEAKATYSEDRDCETGLEECLPYRVTLSGASMFNNDDLASAITILAVLKMSNTDVQLCFSDSTLPDEFKKNPKFYEDILNSSSYTEDEAQITKDLACTTLTDEQLRNISDM